MTKFRPCIDLHEGRVKQIVGGTLDSESARLETNFVSERPADWYAEKYRDDELAGGHVIKLGPGNDEAARAALSAWQDGLQVGGGITAENAQAWIEAGASQVIVTSHLFDSGKGTFLPDRLERLVERIGVERVVIDLSCRRAVDHGGLRWVVAMNRWQTPTNLEVNEQTLDRLAGSCAEFLIHAADVEGRCEGIDEELVAMLGAWGGRPITYAGGANSFDDLARVDTLSGGRVDLTIGSALDIFGGSLVSYDDCVMFNRRVVSVAQPDSP